jgi:hypothetical protein
MYLTEAERIATRAEKIESWFDYLDGLYGDLMSRPEETSSLAGWNDAPKTKPCECRIQWQRGRLCLACDNTGWRSIADGETGIDPYSAGVKQRTSFLLVESDGAKKARGQRQMDSTILRLERNELVRQGLELPEGSDARFFRLVAKIHSTLDKILLVIGWLFGRKPDFRMASRGQVAFVLAQLVPGRLHFAPDSFSGALDKPLPLGNKYGVRRARNR